MSSHGNIGIRINVTYSRLSGLLIAISCVKCLQRWDYTAQKMKFSIKDFFSKCDQIRVTFTEEIINGKFHFLCSVANLQDCRIRVRRWMCNSRKKEMKIKVLVKYKIQKRQSFIFPVYLRLLLKLGNIRKPALQFRTQSAPAIFTCWNSTIETL